MNMNSVSHQTSRFTPVNCTAELKVIHDIIMPLLYYYDDANRHNDAVETWILDYADFHATYVSSESLVADNAA